MHRHNRSFRQDAQHFRHKVQNASVEYHAQDVEYERSR